MEQNPSSVVDTDLAKAREATGIMEGAENDPLTESDADPQGDENQETTLEPSTADGKPAKSEEDDADDQKSDDDNDEAGAGDKSPSHKPTPAERQLFRGLKAQGRQISEVADSVKALAEAIAKSNGPKEEPTPTQDVASQRISELAKSLATKHGLDEDQLNDLASGIVTIIKDLTPKEQANLSPDVQAQLEKVGVLLKKEAENSEAQQIANHFEEEWNVFLPALQKQYPNAKASELAQAKELMINIAHSDKGGVVVDEAKREIRGYPLDFILYQNRQAFDTILRTAAKNRGAEGGGKDLGTEEDESIENEDIDLDPENMTPAKFAKRQAQKIAQNSRDRRDPEMIS